MKKSQVGRTVVAAVELAVLTVMGLASGRLVAQTVISADGVVESASGGFKFPEIYCTHKGVPVLETSFVLRSSGLGGHSR